MTGDFDLESYLTRGVEDIVKTAVSATLENPRGSLFWARFAASAGKANRRRAGAARQGEHVPGFLIASISEQCNLRCAGCYAWANQACSGREPRTGMTREEWGRVFREARDMGVSFILLGGGEPLMRADVLEEAAGCPDILFPVFTNGTLLKDALLTLFDRNRNLVPVLSIEGGEDETDRRRGAGVYRRLLSVMNALDGRGILYGVSVTVTTENLKEALSPAFLEDLRRRGCRAVIYVEYVPVDGTARAWAPGERERRYMRERLRELRDGERGPLLISFPGDESVSGGCLAAGRGFFHINARGGAEPCPFSPYSDTNVKEKGLRAAMKSSLFCRLAAEDMLAQPHDGGCVLFRQADEVRRLAEPVREE